MTTATRTLTSDQENAFHMWWMSDVPLGSSLAEEQCRAAFIEGWLCGEGDALDGATAPLMEALDVAQNVIHLGFCKRDGGECRKECREARKAWHAAKEATS